MFFAPPEVKSLSRYSDFGSHRTNREFLITFIIALLLHAVIVGIYSMSPREEAMRIPVRVLNIKFSGDSAGEEQPPGGGNPGNAIETLVPGTGQIGLEASRNTGKTGSGSAKNQVIEILDKNAGKKKAARTDDNSSKEQGASKPKKYYRDSELDLERTGKVQGNGSGIAGSAEGDEIVKRYTQEISLLVEQHKNYPAEIIKQGLEGKTLVRIRINRGGHIVYSAIEVSSGNETIDQMALAMVKDTGAMPPFPDTYHEDEIEFLLPVSFILQ